MPETPGLLNEPDAFLTNVPDDATPLTQFYICEAVALNTKHLI